MKPATDVSAGPSERPSAAHVYYLVIGMHSCLIIKDIICPMIIDQEFLASHKLRNNVSFEQIIASPISQ